MVEPLVEQVLQKLKQSAELYHKLTMVVGPAGSGKTKALQEAQHRTGATLVNLNLELSRRMLDLTERQRALQIPRILNEIIGSADGDVILLDNIEILFDINFKQDPLRLLQGLSRNRPIVAAWNGVIDNDYLTYAVPEHPEFRRYLVRDFLVATTEART